MMMSDPPVRGNLVRIGPQRRVELCHRIGDVPGRGQVWHVANPKVTGRQRYVFGQWDVAGHWSWTLIEDPFEFAIWARIDPFRMPMMVYGPSLTVEDHETHTG